MKKEKFLIILLLILFSVVGMSATIKKRIKASINPATNLCRIRGGKSILVKSKKGNYRICLFKNKAYEEWEYYRNYRN